MKLFYVRVVPTMTGNRKTTRKFPRGSGPILRLISADSTLNSTKAIGSKWKGAQRKTTSRLYKIGIQILFMLFGVLLGRAVILNTFMPFVLPSYAVAMQMKKGNSFWLALGLILGSTSAVHIGGNPLVVLAMLVSFRLLYTLVKRFDSIDSYSLPLLVMVVDAGIRFGFSLPYQGFNDYALGIALIEGLLAWLLSYMFMQVPPLLFAAAHRPWRIEETIAIVILFSSVLSGLQGLEIHGVFIESIVARYLVLIFAAVGGAGIGGAIGIVTGVILALGSALFVPLIGVFGFAGVLAGMLHEARKPIIAIGFIVGSAILTLYVAKQTMLIGEMTATVIAAVGFLATPSSLIQKWSEFLPGTVRHSLRQQEHVRKIKTMMTSRIEEIATLFSQLSGSFKDISDPVRTPDSVSSQVMERTVHEICHSCAYQSRCWVKNAELTFHALQETVLVLDQMPDMKKDDMPEAMLSRCIKPDLLLAAAKEAKMIVSRHQNYMQQLRESRQIVAEQLSGVADIMMDLAEEIQTENGANHQHEAAILRAFERLGLEVEDVEIISLEEGKIEIDVLQLHPSVHDEPGKLVAPLLSEILGETITVRTVERFTDHSAQRVRLSSARQFKVTSGSASVAKDGTLQSGDSFSVIDVGNGKCAIALSDGMGNGERANQESSAAVTLVQQLLRAGFPEDLAIKTVNSALVLRSTDEMYATLDLAIVDLYTAKTEFLKVGSVPSFIKQGRNVAMVKGESLPIGILEEIEIQTKSMHLNPGDLLVFMSDGIFEGLLHLYEPEEWVRGQLERIATDDPQRLADWLLESAVRAAGGLIRDDMTIVCAKLERYKPGWSTIRLPEMPTIRTEKDRKRLKKTMELGKDAENGMKAYVRVKKSE